MIDFDYELKDETRIIPLSDHILVCDMENGGKKLASGLIILDDNGKTSGIRPRECTVYAIGKNIDYLDVGNKILVAHGRWSRGVRIKTPTGENIVVRRIDPADILLVMEN